eukprot:GDKI01041416.1.p2 GENE.GDKI01041416.1~~GDKI01041416.1.p2  ORF type:complete len:104 (-),score=9.95 GDKI01041416.1:189-500(-)
MYSCLISTTGALRIALLTAAAAVVVLPPPGCVTAVLTGRLAVSIWRRVVWFTRSIPCSTTAGVSSGCCGVRAGCASGACGALALDCAQPILPILMGMRYGMDV